MKQRVKDLEAKREMKHTTETMVKAMVAAGASGKSIAAAVASAEAQKPAQRAPSKQLSLLVGKRARPSAALGCRKHGRRARRKSNTRAGSACQIGRSVWKPKIRKLLARKKRRKRRQAQLGGDLEELGHHLSGAPPCT